MCYAAAVLAAVGSSGGSGSSSSSALGWIATFGAAMIFTFTTTPMKSPLLATLSIDPMLFAFFTLCGIFLVSIPLAVYLASVSAFVYKPFGILGAFDIFIINFFAVSAVGTLGVAVAPGIWAGIGMIIAFLLGTFAFNEEVRNRDFAAIALTLLAAGVYSVSTSKEQERERNSSSGIDPPPQPSPSTEYELAACETENDKTAASVGAISIDFAHDNNQADSSGKSVEEQGMHVFGTKNNIEPLSTAAAAAEASLSVPFGIFCCVMTGVCDGSLMVPFKLSTLHSGTASVNEQMNYLASFGLSAAFLAPALFGFYTIVLRRPWPQLDHLKAATFPGVASGVIWACANLMSVTGTFLLGMNVAFPLTQTCALLSAFWGVLYFGETVGKPLRFLFGICSVILGSYFLAASK